MSERKKYIGHPERVFTKVGNDMLRRWAKRLDEAQFYNIARELSNAYKNGCEVIHVTSGAIAAGEMKTGKKYKDGLEIKKYLAGIGQYRLMAEYEKAFDNFGQLVSQSLILSDELNDEKKLSEYISGYCTGLKMRTIPIINNNDKLSTAELGYSENDELLADVAIKFNKALPKKPLAIILSNYELHDKNPKNHKSAKPISIVYEINDEIIKLAEDEEEGNGMRAKLAAAKRMTENGIPVIIANGRYRKTRRDIIMPIIYGEDIGTLFVPKF